MRQVLLLICLNEFAQHEGTVVGTLSLPRHLSEFGTSRQRSWPTYWEARVRSGEHGGSVVEYEMQGPVIEIACVNEAPGRQHHHIRGTQGVLVTLYCGTPFAWMDKRIS